jgi:ankyrin repeat protein
VPIDHWQLNFQNSPKFDLLTSIQYAAFSLNKHGGMMHSCKHEFTQTPHLPRIIIALFVIFFWSNGLNAQNSKMLVNQTIFEQVLAAALTSDGDRLKSFADANQLDALDSRGLSAVLYTVKLGRLNATQLLIDAGANVDAHDPELSKNIIDQTAYLYAGATGNNAALKILIKARARGDIYNYYGGTALIPAAEKGHVDTVKLLLEESSINVNHVNNMGWTALMEAVVLSNGGAAQQQIVRLLLNHDADPNIADNEGVTALQHAQSKGFGEIAEILKAHGQ